MSEKRDQRQCTAADAGVFAQCTPKERRRLEQLSTPIEVKAGYELTREGRIGREFGIIVEGTAAVTIGGRQVATLRAGDHFGEVALLDRVGTAAGRRTATVTAETDLVVSVLSAPEFSTVLHELPEVAEAVRRAARERSAAH